METNHPITKKQRGRGHGRGQRSIFQHLPTPGIGEGVGLGSGGGPPGGAGDVGAVIDEGISRRRAELRRLQEKSKLQRHAMNNKSSPREASSATLSATAPPLSNNTALSSQPPVPPVPIRPAVASLRHQSDLFPSVPKSPSVKKETVNEEDSQIAAFANASTFHNEKNKDNHDGKNRKAMADTVGVGLPPMSVPSTNRVRVSRPSKQLLVRRRV
mmetsp:Transcript_29054/g.33007  ORF Transcript_29054/g.33007 Transcript_29054/m.33007 type:complete len:214 (-) Transcript_29054:12-653(-)